MIAHARRLKARRLIAALCHTVETGDNGVKWGKNTVETGDNGVKWGKNTVETGDNGGDQQQKRAKNERRKQIKKGRANSPRP